jgi:hypothetical protein
MSKRSISIERLEIRLKGISPQLARSSVSGLGRDLLGQLASLQSLSSGRRAIKIDGIDAGTYRLPGETAPSELRRVIARRIAASVEPKLKQRAAERELSPCHIS